MAKSICSVCQTSDGVPQNRQNSRLRGWLPSWLSRNFWGDGQGSSREVRLPNIYETARSCKLCSFVTYVLDQDVKDTKTPRKGDSSYNRAKVRVENRGLKFTGQWHGALVIDVYSPEGKSSLPKPNDVPTGILCDNASEIITRWLDICKKEHPECHPHRPVEANLRGSAVLRYWYWFYNMLNGTRPQPIEHFLPKRLIKIGDNGETATLVESSGMSMCQYAALSYCWEGNGTVKTYMDKLRAFQEPNGIPVEAFSQTIKDALCLTKKLGLNYLWVDALCIVQGRKEDSKEMSKEDWDEQCRMSKEDWEEQSRVSKKDWEEQSQQMGKIYSNADIVLAATRSIEDDKGMFSPRLTTILSPDIKQVSGDGSIMRARRNLNHEIITSCRTKSDKWWEENINGTFRLLSRGWAFQERMLATRVVHFTPLELVWECQKMRSCECQVLETGLYPAVNNFSSALRRYLKQPDNKQEKRQMWREIVRSYSVRQLTCIKDKLPALSGIAALFQESSGDIYAAGLWQKSLPYDLLWRCDQSRDLQEAKTEPSWSWISVNGTIIWPDDQHSKKDQALTSVFSTAYFERGAEGVECKVECEADGKDNKFGRVKTGKLKMKTYLKQAEISLSADEAWDREHGTKWEIRAGSSDPAPFWPDLNMPQSGKPSKLDLAWIANLKRESGFRQEALVVRKTESSVDEYERIGVAARNISTRRKLQTCMTKESWFYETSAEDITIV